MSLIIDDVAFIALKLIVEKQEEHLM